MQLPLPHRNYLFDNFVGYVFDKICEVYRKEVYRKKIGVTDNGGLYNIILGHNDHVEYELELRPPSNTDTEDDDPMHIIKTIFITVKKIRSLHAKKFPIVIKIEMLPDESPFVVHFSLLDVIPIAMDSSIEDMVATMFEEMITELFPDGDTNPIHFTKIDSILYPMIKIVDDFRHEEGDDKVPEIKVDDKETPKSLRDKVVDVIDKAMTNLCGVKGLFETCVVESVKLPAFTERRICDNKTDKIYCRCLTIEESDHIHVKMLDYLAKAGEESETSQTDMDIVKIFTNDKNNPNVWGKLIDPACFCSFSMVTRLAVEAIRSALFNTKELDINWTFWDYPEPELAPTKDCWTLSNSKQEPDVALDKLFSRGEAVIKTEARRLTQNDIMEIITTSVNENLTSIQARARSLPPTFYGCTLETKEQPSVTMPGARCGVTFTIRDRHDNPLMKFDIFKAITAEAYFALTIFDQLDDYCRFTDICRNPRVLVINATNKHSVSIEVDQRINELSPFTKSVARDIIKSIKSKFDEISKSITCDIEWKGLGFLSDEYKEKILGGEAIEYPSSTTIEFEKLLPPQRCLNIICGYDKLVTEIKGDIVHYRCPKCGVWFRRTLENVRKRLDEKLDKGILVDEQKSKFPDKENIPSFYVDVPEFKTHRMQSYLRPILTWDHLIMLSHIAENNKEENEMNENKKCVIECDGLISIVQTFLNNTSEYGRWKNKPETIKTDKIIWRGTKQCGMYFPLIGMTSKRNTCDEITGFEIWNTCSGNRENINIRIDHEGIKFIENSDFNDFGYEFIHNLYEFIKDNLDETKIKNQIKDIIFSDPATTVIWADGTKTTVQTQVLEYTTTTKPDGTVVKKPKKRVPFDPESALAACIMNKMFGSHSAYAKYVNGYVVKSEEKKKKKAVKKTKKEKELTLPKEPTKKPNTKARKVTIEGGKK